MNLSKKAKIIISAIVLGVVAAGCVFAYISTHVFVGGHAYEKKAAELDLRESSVTVEEFQQLTQALPQCDILWNVPFQDGFVSSDSSQLSVTQLHEEDLALIPYFAQLKTVNAVGCTDYPQLMKLKELAFQAELLYTVAIDGQDYPQDAQKISVEAISDEEIGLLQYLPQLSAVDARDCTDLPQLRKLQEAFPDLSVNYQVSIFGTNYERTATELTLSNADTDELNDLLYHMPALTSVHLTEPVGSAESLLALQTDYPQISFSWEKNVLGLTVTSEDTEVDLSGTTPESIEEIESSFAYFPNLEKLLLCGLPFENEDLAAYRDRVRQDYKVVWTVVLGRQNVRTDETTYMPFKSSDWMDDEMSYNLRYCEDMLCVDMGHMRITHCDWAAFMPNLKYLIMADCKLNNIQALAGLKNLVFLEIFITKVTDLTPLLTCTGLEDLNLCYTKADPEPIKQMTWLKNLWWADCSISEEEFQTYLPNTKVDFYCGSSTGRGWRKLQNYYDMRDLLGMPYFTK